MAYQDLYNSYGGVNSMMGTDPYDTGEPDTQANTQPVTQTIKFDPVTGEQQMTIKGRPEDLSPANPNTPTLMMPGQTAPVAAPAMMPAPAAAPAPAMMPAAPAPATEQTQSNYNPESIAQALQQAGLSYVPPQPIATLAQAGTSDVNPPAVTMPPAATTVPQTTMPTGGLRMPAPAAVAPTTAPTPAAVAPMAAPAPMTAQPSAAPAPVAARPPAMDGAALTRQSESGGDYNVGYNRAGTTDAYGAYQILSSTYKGIQAADPYFQGKDQKTLSPADQDRANNVLRNLNSQGLASQGVEATEPNIQLAHYLGATGASEYLKTGYISPEAAAANGGYEAADRIARDRIRMAGGNPDSIPKNAQLSAQDITEFANNKQLGPLMDIYKKNPTSPEGRAALASITTIQTQEADLIKAKKQIENAMSSSRGNAEIGKLLTAQKEEGSWGKYLLAGLLGMGDIAKAEGVKLGLNNTWSSVQLADGTTGMVQMRGDGLPVQGITSKGAMTASELAESAGGAGGKTKPDVSTQDVQKGDIKGRVVTTYDRNNRPTTFVESGGKRYNYDSSWTPVSIGTATAKAEQGAAIKLRYAGPMAYTEAGAKAAGDYNFQHGTNIGYAAQVPGAPLVDLNTGRVVTPDANGNISVTQTQAPGSRATPGAAAPVRPPAAPAGPVTPPAAAAPVTTPAQTLDIPSTTTPQGTAASSQFTPSRPDLSPSAYAKEEKEFFEGRAQAQKIQSNRSESFNKIIDTEYRELAQKGDIVSKNRKEQFAIFNRLDENGKPVGEQLAALYSAANDSPTDQKLAIVRDIFGGIFKEKTEVSQRIANLNLSPKAQAALAEYNALNGAISAQTLKETAGPGAVSDAEQEANKARNVDITKVPLIGAYQMMAQSQFSGDLQRYKSDLAVSDNNTASNATQFDRNFRQISSKLTNAYRQIAEDRLKYIQENGNTANAIRDGYRRFPIPQYDPVAGNWKYLKPLNQIFGDK